MEPATDRLADWADRLEGVAVPVLRYTHGQIAYSQRQWQRLFDILRRS